MSNFICPHCQQIIDDGSDGFTSNREIVLEKKLEIAVKALITYKNLRYDGTVTGYEYIAKEALAKIKEIK